MGTRAETTLGGAPELTLAGPPRAIGATVTRSVDDGPLSGRATYVGDLRLPGMVELALVRSPLAHARVTGIHAERARAAAGVLAVVTGSDLTDVRPFPDFFPYAQPVRTFPLARDLVRYVGSPVAAVVAADRYAAEDAAELVEVDYEELPAVASVEAALADGAPRLYEDWPDNRMMAAPEGGLSQEVTDILAGAATVVRGRYAIHRHTGVPMETRACLAEWRDGRLTLWTTCQLPHVTRTSLTFALPSLSERDIRVVAPAVGGGFGVKQHIYPEEVLAAWSAMRLGRPVRWIEDRTEHLVATVHARDEVIDIEGAIRADGTIEALRAHVYHDLGSGEVFYAGFAPGLTTGGHMTGPYRIDKAAVAVTGAVTNKTPAGSFRGYGVPEAVFALERFIERAARAVGADPVEARRKMLLTDADLPYTAPTGAVMDSGSFAAAYERALHQGREAAAGWRERLANQPNVRVGMGAVPYREGTAPTHFGASGYWASQECASVRVEPDGSVVVSSGATTQGQGVETLLATVTADALGIAHGDVRVIMGDTDRCPYGMGAWGSRNAVFASGAVLKACATVRDKAMRIAAHALEADASDLVAAEGRVAVRGTDRGLTYAEIGTLANVRTMNLPADVDPGLEATAFYDAPNLQHVPDEMGRINAAAAWANAAHAAVIGVDLETGELTILDYFVAHDCGPILNPPIVDGQVIGGVAHGIGGAMYEDLAYTPEGQPMAVSFMDYLIPSATEIPRMTLSHFESPSPVLPLGVKGVGEGGTCGPLGALGNAIADALSEFGVDVVRSPFTPATIRSMIEGASAP